MWMMDTLLLWSEEVHHRSRVVHVEALEDSQVSDEAEQVTPPWA